MNRDPIAAALEARQAQGLPVKVTDPATLRSVAVIVQAAVSRTSARLADRPVAA